MAITFSLKTPNAEKSPIYITVTAKNQRFRKSTEIVIETERWNKKTQSIRDLKSYPSPKPLNLRLNAMRDAAEKVYEEVMASSILPTSDEFWRKYSLALDGVAEKRTMTFTEYMGVYAERRKKNSVHNTAKQYLTSYRHLCAYEEAHRTKIHFSDVTLRFYESFKRYMLHRGYNLNSIGTIVKNIKVAYRDARDVDGLHALHETDKRGFSSANCAAKTIYLSLDELKRIAEVKITPEALLATYPELKTDSLSMMPNLKRKAESLNIIRNKFILGAYTALRVSDFNHLKNVHVDGNYFRISTQKTGAVVVIPIHPIIRKMIDGGFDIATPITDQKINKHIKEVAKMAGITQVVEGTKIVEHKAVVGFYPKCDIITTHTARRSAATNMFKAGIPSISIMKITGHTTEKAFMKYIKISAEENAELMAKNKFFKGEK
jgi:hypothetical protein